VKLEHLIKSDENKKRIVCGPKWIVANWYNHELYQLYKEPEIIHEIRAAGVLGGCNTYLQQTNCTVAKN
jgi:hypothetical protein